MKLMKLLKWLLAGSAAILIIQFAFFFSVCARNPGPEKPDLVVVYGGLTRSSLHGLELAKAFDCPIYFSESVQTVHTLQKALPALSVPVTIDPRARTTDQNARYAAPFIRNGGYKRVALVCAWHHMPRALFLARLYLLGSGMKVVPYPNETSPERFWAKRNFWRQFLMLWGSLLRVGLHCFGVDDWPQTQLLASY
jgi:uncharacterized SAM-binding protein YcdF (DUF218 family)